MTPSQLSTGVCLFQQPEETTREEYIHSPQSVEAREALGMMQCFSSTKHYFVIRFRKDAFRNKAMPDEVSWIYRLVGAVSYFGLGSLLTSCIFPCPSISRSNVRCSIWHKYQ